VGRSVTPDVSPAWRVERTAQHIWLYRPFLLRIQSDSRLRLKCDGTRAETRFRLSAKRTSQFKSAWGVSSVDYWQPRCAHQR